MSLKMIPPVRAHFRYKDFFLNSKSFITWRKPWSDFFETENIYGFGMGRAALTNLLDAMKKLQPNRNEVILSAYTCPSVLEVILRENLVPKLCDVYAQSSVMNVEKLESLSSSNTLAIISGNLFGIPDSIEEIKTLAQKCGAFLIEDLALSVGTKVNGKNLGTFGDAAFLSLGLGKVLTTGGGGILSVRNPVLKNLIREPDMKKSLKAKAKLLTYPIVFSNLGFGMLARSPVTIPEGVITDLRPDDFAWTEFQANLSANLLMTLSETNAVRVRHGEEIFKIVSQSELQNLRTFSQNSIHYLRFPVLASSEVERTKSIHKLKRHGFYPSLGFPGMEPKLKPGEHPEALQLCQRMFTIPCHQKITSIDLLRLSKVLLGK